MTCDYSACENLSNREFFEGGLSRFENVRPKEELLLDCSVAQHCSSEVLVDFADRDVEVEAAPEPDEQPAQNQNCVGEQKAEVGGQLHVHAPELDSPADRRVETRRRLQSNVEPVRGLDRFEEAGVLRLGLRLGKFLDSFPENAQVVSGEYQGKMVEQFFVQRQSSFFAFSIEEFPRFFVVALIHIVVGSEALAVVRDVHRGRPVPAPESCIPLLQISVVAALVQDVPANVGVQEHPLVHRSRGAQGQLGENRVRRSA